MEEKYSLSLSLVVVVVIKVGVQPYRRTVPEDLDT